MEHVIRAQQFNQKSLVEIFRMADKLEGLRDRCLQNKIMASLFYEPSTRTRFSFESAMLHLGGQVIGTENAQEFSSAMKGETIEDTVRVVSNYADIIVLRHFEEGASQRASRVSRVPIVNAGDGAGQHPTQALIDLYTINRELGKIDGIHIAMIGDLKHGRTVRSLSYLLGKYSNITIYFISPKELKIGKDILSYLNRHKISFIETEQLHTFIKKFDVIYQTRIQKERFRNTQLYKKLKGVYQINNAVVKRIKSRAIIMHPLPRVDEILPEVDTSKKAVYFKQTYYGLLIRMALLKLLLERNPRAKALT